MAEPWEESLDLDDTSFPFILRPCNTTNPKPLSLPSSSTTLLQTLTNSPKRQRIINQSTLSHSHSHSHSHSFQKAETLANSQLQQSPVLPRTIPGPAGVVLAALHRRRSGILETESKGEMTTQEYLKKAVGGNGMNTEFDDDFNKLSWTAALEFVQGGGETAPLGSIKKGTSQRLNKVVAMIKSCTPNGFGDFMAMLKDPSGTISASIHRSVVNEGNHGCNLSVGAVLVLEKVSVFSPCVECYLNITHRNVVKIFPKDFVSFSNNVTESAVVADCEGEETSLVQNSSSEGIQLANRSASNEVRGTVSNFERQSVNKLLNGNKSTKDSASKSLRGFEKQNEHTRETRAPDCSTGINNKAQAAFTGGNHSSAVRREQPGEANKMIQQTTAIADDSNGAKKQMQPATSLSSLPEWTDEQLEELLMED